MNIYTITVYADGDDGSTINLGTVRVTAHSKQNAHVKALDMLWDNRLDSASCRARFETTEQNLRIDSAAIGHIMMQDVAGDYDAPETVPEWQWVERNASYDCRGNGFDGVWEFILNLAKTFEDIPEKLAPVIEKARQSNLAYLIFHQGT